MLNKKQWVVIDGVLECNPSKEQIKNSKYECCYIYPGEDDDTVIQSWRNNDGSVINYSYSLSLTKSMICCEDNYYNPKYYDRKRHYERHKIRCGRDRLRWLVIPKRFILNKGIINLEHFMY